ncbi:MAG: hypothetical protein Kow00123_20460 [Anaerolineales bacterium]
MKQITGPKLLVLAHILALEGRLRTSENAVSGAPKATADPRPDSPKRISGISAEMYTLPRAWGPYRAMRGNVV